jgi:hypothetical protein
MLEQVVFILRLCEHVHAESFRFTLPLSVLAPLGFSCKHFCSTLQIVVYGLHVLFIFSVHRTSYSLSLLTLLFFA